VGIRGLQRQTFSVPLAAGLQQKADPRALPPPGLSRAVNVQFTETGGIQTRKPSAPLAATLTDIRRIYENGDELVAFTKTALHSWSPTLGAWVSKGTHLAIEVEEASMFSTAGDQVDADRAELDGVAFYTWIEGTIGYVAAVDRSSGAVMMSPTTFAAFSSNARAPRLVALATRVLLIFQGSGQLYFVALDPQNPSDFSSVDTILTSGIGASAKYDVCQVGSSDTAILACKRTTTTSYSVATITAAGLVTTTTVARDCTGAIAVAVEPTGASVQVIRANGTTVQGDLITIAGFVDVFTAQAIGTTPTNAAEVISACFRSVQDAGVYRCYAFWASDQTSAGGSDWYSSSNWVSTGNTLGTEGIFKRRWAPRARAFDRAGEVYVWGAFFGRTEFDPFGNGIALQSTYFLLRDDGFLSAKAVTNTAGAGAAGVANDGNGWIPGCQDLGGGQYAFAAVSCRVINTGSNNRDYAARTPREVLFSFDSDNARRCVRLGQTLYIACAEGVMQYDGAALFELGYHQAPWYVIGAETASGGIAANGTYAFKLTWRSANAKGETERSTSSVVGAVDIASQPAGVSLASTEPLYLTHRSSVALEAWRTKLNPTDEAPFFLVTSPDSADLTNPNRFVFNDTTASALPTIEDEIADVDLEDNEENPENGGVLESVQPPPAKIIIASADRLFLAGVAGDPHRIWYSKQRQDGEVAAFNDALTFTVPRAGGAITALAFVNETLIVFRETAIYAVPGDGFDNAGGGANFGQARQLAGDVGAVSQEAIGVTPGGVLFKSAKGWYMLNRGWAVNYVGAPIADYDTEDVVSVQVLEDQHHIRCLTSSRMLVLDYLADQWAEWTITGGVHAAVWGGTYHHADSTQVLAEQATYALIDYGIDVETAWIKLADVQGYGRVWKLLVLGEYRGAHGLRFRVGKNYATSYFQDRTITPRQTVVGEPLQEPLAPKVQEMEAIRLRLTAMPITADVGDGPFDTYTEALKLTNLSLELGIELGAMRTPIAAAT
jgi:hypothetical protein